MKRKIRGNIIADRIKTVLSLKKELESLYEAERNLGYIMLDKPIRDGWYRTFRLRDDIKRSKYGKVYQEILDKVVVHVHGSEKKYANKFWNKYFKNTLVQYQRPGIRYLNKEKYLSLSVKAQKHFFCLDEMNHRISGEKYICTLPRYYFKIAYERAYITKRKIIAPELERRQQEILEILYRPEYYKYYYNYNYRHWHNPNKRMRRATKMNLNQFDIDKLESLSSKL